MKDFVFFYTADDQDHLDYFAYIVRDVGSALSRYTKNSVTQLLHALENPPPAPQLRYPDLDMPGNSNFAAPTAIRSLESFTLDVDWNRFQPKPVQFPYANN